MNKMLTTCKMLLTYLFIIYFLAACGGDKQPTGTTEKSSAPVAAPEQEKVKPVESQAERKVVAAPEPEVKVIESQSQPTQSQEKTPTPSSGAPQQEEMLALAKKSGCMACHAVDKKIVGPAWKDVARRYAGNAGAREQLIEKVSKGGKGNWTDIVGSAAMPPYYPRVTKENIGKLVDFVLSLPN